MTLMNRIYSGFSYIWHQLSAWNTGGEGIHSPYLFYIVRMLLYDSHSYYCFAEIESRRQAMLNRKDTIWVEDYGTGVSGEKRISDIAKSSLKPAKEAQQIFKIVNYLSSETKGGLDIIELGTSLGITTAYLANASANNRIITFEGSPELVNVAKDNWAKLGLHNIKYVEGNIDSTLYNNARAKKLKQVDLAFIDANHTGSATMNYFNIIKPLIREKSIVIIDDIHYSRDMYKAWLQIQNDQAVTSTMDLFHCGIVFFDKHYIKRHYKLRV